MANKNGWRCKSCGRDLGDWPTVVSHLRDAHQVGADEVVWTIEYPQHQVNENLAVALVDDVDLSGVKMEHTIRVWAI
jgi:hypothetical protein